MTTQCDSPPPAKGTACVALVDDDAVFLRLLADNLRAAGLAPLCYTDPQVALAALRRPPAPDACILDWNMPGIDGLDLLTQLRQAGFRQPVLFLTSHSQPMFEEAALTAGAVDFVDKARGPAIILRRLALALERVRPPETATSADDDLRVGELFLRRRSKRALWRGQDIALSRGEYEVIALLAERAGADVGYRDIYDAVRSYGFAAGHGDEGYRANVRAMVKRIRRKFVDSDPSFAALDNYPGFGYRWRPRD
jgi:two-component system, OmpR family, response regulator ChvI